MTAAIMALVFFMSSAAQATVAKALADNPPKLGILAGSVRVAAPRASRMGREDVSTVAGPCPTSQGSCSVCPCWHTQCSRDVRIFLTIIQILRQQDEDLQNHKEIMELLPYIQSPPEDFASHDNFSSFWPAVRAYFVGVGCRIELRTSHVLDATPRVSAFLKPLVGGTLRPLPLSRNKEDTRPACRLTDDAPACRQRCH